MAMEADRVYARVEDRSRLETIETGILLTETNRMHNGLNPIPVPKNTELRFSKKISQPTLTCHEIKGEGNTCIEVLLIDSSTGKKIEVGPVAFASVELVVLAHGTDDCIGEGFTEKILTVEGKKPLLTVNLCKLQGGSCVLEGVRFRHHATQVKPKVFRIGARIVGTYDGIIVREAKTESFDVKCYRNKYFMKNEIPNLTDKIWVLKNIQRNGKIDERLKAEGIDTIEKFLIHLLIHPQDLKNIAKSKGKKWEGTLNHARKCQSDKMYWYLNSQENSGVAFDIFGELQLMYSRGEYAATNMLSEGNKYDADKLLSSAFKNWKDVNSFDDLYLLQQHLEDVKTSFNLSNSHIPGQYPGMNPYTGAAEMVDGSNNIQVPEPLLNQEIPISDMSSVELYESFYPRDFGFVDDLRSPIDLCFSNMFTDFDIGYEGHVARLDGTGSVLAESMEVENDVLLMRKDLNRKKIASEANPAKKQKI